MPLKEYTKKANRDTNVYAVSTEDANKAISENVDAIPTEDESKEVSTKNMLHVPTEEDIKETISGTPLKHLSSHCSCSIPSCTAKEEEVTKPS